MEENQNPIAFSSQSPSTSSHSFESISSSSPLKYYGLQKRNYFKIFQKDINQLINYVFSISPPFNIVHKIISAIRILQFLLPCLIPAYLNFWKVGSVDQITMNVIAVLYYLIPPTETSKASLGFLIFYDVIQLFIILVVISSSYYFKKNAKLPWIIPPFIYLYHSTFGHYFNSIVLYLIFETLSRMMISDTVSISRYIAVIVISLICFFFNSFFMAIFNKQTLIFRPNSLASLTSQPQFII